VIVGDDSEWQAYRADRVDELLRQDNRDSRYRQARKIEQWGSFANASTPQDLALIVSQQHEEIAAEHSRKAAMAQAAGVFYDVLLPPDQEDFVTVSSSDSQSNGRISLSLTSERTSSSFNGWLSNIDEELRNEWAALTAGDSGESSAAGSPDNEENDDLESAELDSPESLPLSEENSDTNLLLGVQLDTSTGKIVNRQNLAGVRVGSAGGWSLEVFPGDFVVHRRYGIGRFE
jgi:transcription-repair coupling factor (superfamily II helicase)